MRCKQSSIIRGRLAEKISKMQSFAARLGWFSCKVNRQRTWRSLQHFSGISLFASTSSTETDKTTVTSKHHFLSTATWCNLEHTASWSRHYQDTRHLPSISLGQCCVYFSGTHGDVMFSSAARPSCQGRLANLSPGGHACVTTQVPWGWDSQQPGAASAGQAAEGNAKWRSVSGNHHFSKPQIFFKLTAHHRKYLLTLSVLRAFTHSFGWGGSGQFHFFVPRNQC